MYNDALKQVVEEQALLNLVRVRYHDSPMRLDVASIAAQYELNAGVQAQPFFGVNATNTVIGGVSRILPFGSLQGSNRPTISLTPLDDPETIRNLFRPTTLDSIIFLSETSFPVSTVYRMFVEYLNGVPNAASASGPQRDVVPEFQEFQEIAQMMQILQDRGDLRFVRREEVTELGSRLPAERVTADALVDAARNGFEYRQQENGDWTVTKRNQRLEMRFSPRAVESPEAQEIRRLLHLKSGSDRYEVTVSAPGETFERENVKEPVRTINISPRSVVQAAFYLANGVSVPPEHAECGLASMGPSAAGGTIEWPQITEGLFRVCSVKQRCRPKDAYAAVKYRGYWFYIDDRDADSKATFSLMMMMTQINQLGVRKGGPALTLPLGP
jgi:hypothetical protein